MASEAFEKWWAERPVTARLGAVHASEADLAEQSWAASRRQAIEECAAEAEKAAAETMSDNADAALSDLAARLRGLA